MLFAACAPGIEPVLLAEVRALGLQGRAEAGGVLIEDDAAFAQVNLWLRTASRVLLRIGEFRAAAFPELVRKAAALPWEKFVPKSAAVSFNVTCRKSRLYHSGGVRERVHAAVQERLRREVPIAEDGQLFIVRLERDVCTISADTSGALLHQRGWRGPQAKAPLRETLAAALLLASGYSGAEPLCDPLCGSGTIPIEAALIAMRRAPGIAREFAFQRWPGFDARRFDELRAKAKEGERSVSAPVEASDQDAGAVSATRQNAAAAAVEIGIAQRRLADLPACGGSGFLACNPPYGVRVAAGNVAGELAEALRRRPGWKLAAITADPASLTRAGLKLQPILKTQNGGLRVEMVRT